MQYKESGLALSQIVEMPSIVLGTELSGNSLWVLCMEAPLINLFTKSVDGQFVAGTVHTALLEVEPTAGAMPGYCETGLLRKWSNWQPDALDHHNKVPAEYPEMKLRKKQKRGGKQRRNSRAAQQSGNA